MTIRACSVQLTLSFISNPLDSILPSSIAAADTSSSSISPLPRLFDIANRINQWSWRETQALLVLAAYKIQNKYTEMIDGIGKLN
jgi:hypothetical protein